VLFDNAHAQKKHTIKLEHLSDFTKRANNVVLLNNSDVYETIVFFLWNNAYNTIVEIITENGGS
jgi:hypothetical protein